MPETLLLIDGHALAYRMYHAYTGGSQELSTSTGEPTEAVFGFTQTLLSLLNDNDPPDYLAVSFDVGESFRVDIDPDYKATREKTPERLDSQIPRIKQMLEAFNIPIHTAEGYEADDVLGTIAEQVKAHEGVNTLILTGDHDLLQLVDERTQVEIPGRRQSQTKIYDAEAVEERYGFRPDQMVDYKALRGDSSDNIPGVAGIGEKYATTLLQNWGTLEVIYENLDEVDSTRARNALDGSREDAFRSRELARIRRDVPMEFDLKACRLTRYNRDKVLEVFHALEFRSLLTQLPSRRDETPVEGDQLDMFAEAPTTVEQHYESIWHVPGEVHIVTSPEELEALAAELEAAEAIAFDTETDSLDTMQANLVGISVAIQPDAGWYIPVGHVEMTQLPIPQVIDALRPALTNPEIPKYAHNIKFDTMMLARYGLQVYPLSFDTMLAEWVLDPEANVGLKDMAWTRLAIPMTEITDLIGKGRNKLTMDEVPIEDAAPYAVADAEVTLRLVEQLRADLEQEPQLLELFETVEMPLVPILIKMEQAGIKLDTSETDRMSDELHKALEDLTEQAYQIAEEEFNLNSPSQLSDILYEKLGLPTKGIRKTKTGYSTAVNYLENLQDKDETGMIDVIMQYRELEKLRGTYVDALPELINPHTGRIHTSFNQTGTVTGRLSSSEPNLQNIPIRTEVGRRIRDAFVAEEGHVLLAADYSQVELRVLAHISGDEKLRTAFQEGQDIHATTAAAVYGVPIDEVDIGQRNFAKRVNFGLLYGMSAFRLARDSDMTRKEADEFVERYFEQFPSVRDFLDTMRQKAQEEPYYLETLLGRRRYFRIFQTEGGSYNRRQAAEREAINMPIQGTAADIIKLAMIDLDEALAVQGLHARMLLQVHDELILEVPEDETQQTVDVVEQVMRDAFDLAVPLQVEAHTGPNWGQLK